MIASMTSLSSISSQAEDFKNEIQSKRHLCFIVINANSVLHRAQCNISIVRIFNLHLPGQQGTLRHWDEKNRFCELWKKGEFILQMRSDFLVIEFLFVSWALDEVGLLLISGNIGRQQGDARCEGVMVGWGVRQQASQPRWYNNVPPV